MRHVAATDDHSVHRALVRLNPSAYAAACPTFGCQPSYAYPDTNPPGAQHPLGVPACLRPRPTGRRDHLQIDKPPGLCLPAWPPALIDLGPRPEPQDTAIFVTCWLCVLCPIELRALFAHRDGYRQFWLSSLLYLTRGGSSPAPNSQLSARAHTCSSDFISCPAQGPLASSPTNPARTHTVHSLEQAYLVTSPHRTHALCCPPSLAGP